MKSSTVKIALGSLFVAVATSASATGTDTSHSIAVSSTVNTTCVVTSGTLAFGVYDPTGTQATTDLAGTASFTLKCTKGAVVSVTMNDGNNASGSQRRLKANAADYLNYNLFQPAGFAPNPGGSAGTCPNGTVWDATLAGTFSFTSASSATNTVNVCGTIPSAQDAVAGSYADTVTMTVNF